MADAVDELYTRWKENPQDAAVTLALCDALRGSGRDPLIQLVGEVTVRDHAQNVAALVATARMYMEAQRLQDAQTVLVSAGKLAPRDATVYRWLGEVLLRRGDADRAEKVLERAVQFGANDTDTRLWMERAKVFRPMQSKAGSRAVAAEIAKSAGLQSSVPQVKSIDEPEEITTEIFSAQKKPPNLEMPTPPPPDGILGMADERSEVFVGPRKPQLANESPTAEAFAPVVMQPRIEEKDDLPLAADDETTLAKPSPLSQQRPIDMTAMPPRASPPPPKLPGGRLPPPPRGMAQMITGGAGAAASAPAPAVSASNGPLPVVASPNPFLSPAPPTAAGPFAPSPSAGPPPFAPPPPGPLGPPPAPPQPPSSRRNQNANDGPALPPYIPPPSMPPLPGAAYSPTDASVPVKKRTPDPRDVLDALQLAGIFEPDGGGQAAAWSKADRGPRRFRSTIVLVLATMLFVGGGFGIYKYIRTSREKQHALAEEILNQVETDLHQGRSAALGTTEQNIGRAFDLDSRSQRAALDWAHERALAGLLKGGSDIAFEDAISRAKEVQVPDDKMAFALLGSFLFQGDTAGAAALMPKWDGPSAGDAFYQLIAGATLERAGAQRAAERYAQAAKLDPNLFAAEMLLARAVAIDGDANKAQDLAKAFRQKYPDRAEGVALVALAWARDPMRGADEPPEVQDTIAHATELPAPLAVVPHAVLALRALDKRAPEDAKGHIQRGLAAADGPGVASWLGTIALDTGDEALAQRAALAAVGFSAVYVPARVLAARVALLGDRLDAALKATEELEPTSADVAVVRAAVAYEKVDADGLSRALEAVPSDAKKLPFLVPLSASNDVLFARFNLTSEKLVAWGADDAPWSDLLAMDIALDAGDLETAQKIANVWKGTEKRPLRALRLARFARYAGRLDDADPLSETAMQGTVTVRALTERVLVLVARGKASEVGPLLAKYPLVLGPMATWLSAYAAASAGKADDARGKISALDPPPNTAPLPLRVIAALAFGAARDHRRGNDYVRAILQTGLSNPDAGAAAVQLGAKKVERPGRPPLYLGPP